MIIKEGDIIHVKFPRTGNEVRGIAKPCPSGKPFFEIGWFRSYYNTQNYEGAIFERLI